MIRWILFSTLAAGVFYSLYQLLFRNDNHLQVRRWYLLSAMAFSLVYPLVQMPREMEMPTVFTLTDSSTLAVLRAPSAGLGEGMEGGASTIDWSWWLMVLYIVGVGLAFALLLVQVGMILHHLWKLGWKTKVHLLDDETSAFSFFHHIIIGTRAMSQEELYCVLAHEQEHARQLHSLDVLLMRLMCSAAWFNPFAWLMLRELRAVHEYQADTAAVQHGDYTEYLSLLYRQAAGIGYGHITNNFQSINLKKRITMMKQQKSRFGAWKALAALPVAALLMMVGCKNAPFANDTLGSPQYGIPDGTYVIDDGDINYVDVFKDGHLMSRFYQGSVEVPLDKIGEMEILHETDVSTLVDRAAEKHAQYRYVRQTRMQNMADPDSVLTDYYELCYSNDSTSMLAWERENAPGSLPEFPGGMEALYKYLAENVQYPEQAKADGIGGRLFVSFIIEKDGSISEVKVVRGHNKYLEEEAVRVVKAMPRWTPGTFLGEPSRAQFNLPITFKLQ